MKKLTMFAMTVDLKVNMSDRVNLRTTSIKNMANKDQED